MGAAEDVRFLNVALEGIHLDIDGGYFRSGWSERCCNLMVDYLNSARDAPFLK